MFHGVNTIDTSIRNVCWSNETDDGLLHPYSCGDSSLANGNTLSESLNRLEDNTRKLRTEISLHTDLIEALTTDPKSLFVSEIKESLGSLCNHVEHLDYEIRSVLQQVELERNERTLQKRMILSLQATLLEADRQLEQAANFEQQLRATEAAQHLNQQRLAHTSRKTTELTELVYFDDDHEVSNRGSHMTENLSEHICNVLGPSAPTISKHEAYNPPVTGEAASSLGIENELHSRRVCQVTCELYPHKTIASDDRSMKPHEKHHFVTVSRRRRILSLNSLQETKNFPPTIPFKRFRSRSITSPPYRISSGLSSNESSETLVQSWLVKRIQSELARRHQAEALLTQQRSELERLQAAENSLRKQIDCYERQLQDLDATRGSRVNYLPCQANSHKFDAVQKYLHDSAHLDQSSVTEFPDSQGSGATVVLDSFYGNSVASHLATPRVVSDQNSPPGPHVRAQYLSPYQDDQLHLTSTANNLSASPNCSVRRHFSEPDLVISCLQDPSTQHLNPQIQPDDTFTPSDTSQRASSVNYSTTQPSFTFSRFRKHHRYLSGRERLHRQRKNTRPNAESLIKLRGNVSMQHLVRFLHRSNALLKCLTSLGQRRSSIHGFHHKQKFLDSLYDFGEAFERFRAFVLQSTDQQIDQAVCNANAILPTRMCQLLRCSIEAEGNENEADIELVSLKQRRISSSLEHVTLTSDQGDHDNLTLDIWQRVDPGLLSREDCYLTDLTETLMTRLNVTRKKLQQQIEQCNEFEALLAERDARIVAQANELSEVEAHLAASAQTVVSLHKQLNISQHNWTQMLLKMQAGGESDTNQQLPAVPAVLELVASLDAAYADLQESERCRLLAEQRASSAQATARRLRLQLRDGADTDTDADTSVADLIKPVAETRPFCREQSTQTEFNQPNDRDGFYSSVNYGHKKPVLCDASVQNCTPDEEVSKFSSKRQTALCEEILQFGLTIPKAALERSLRSHSDAEETAVLREALRNALAQVDRLQKYRTTQKARLEQLQQRFGQISCELDATVDALRHHQTSSEIERRRCAVEMSQLRTQLAKATSLLEHYKLMQGKTNASFSTNSLDRNLPALRASSASPVTLRSSATVKDRPDLLSTTDSNDLALQLSMAQSELAQLRSDMTEQKATADRELTNLRGQLAEATSDARALRLQVTRLQSASSSNGRNDMATVNSVNPDAPCTNCNRLQRLLDLLQAKSHTNTMHEQLPEQMEHSPRNAASTLLDASCQVDLSSETIGIHMQAQGTQPASCDDPQILRQRQELVELEQALKHKELELQKENGRLCIEADRLKRRHDALLDGEAKLKKESELHESHIESQRVALQNEMLHLGRERARLAEERQLIELERNRLHTLQVELKQKRMEAEMLIEMATRETHGNNEISRVGAETRVTYCSSDRQTGAPQMGSGEPHVVANGSAFEPNGELRFPSSTPIGKESAVQMDALIHAHRDLVKPINYWFDWLESALDQMSSAESVDSIATPHLTHGIPLKTSVLESLKSELHKLRAQWNVESELIRRQDEKIMPVTAQLQESSPSEPTQVVSADPAGVSVDQLLKRLRSAEQESRDAIEQLKSSNAEFLTLRERLSHATVERAHLKATVEGLDEQVSQLQNCLHERTEELNSCRAELSRYTQRVYIPLPTEWPVGGKNIRVPSKDLTTNDQLRCALPEATIVTVGPVLDHYVDVTARLRRCGFVFNRYLVRARHRTLEWSIHLRPILQHLGTLRSRLRLQSQPRPRLFLGIFVYFILLHLLLLRCWLY